MHARQSVKKERGAILDDDDDRMMDASGRKTIQMNKHFQLSHYLRIDNLPLRQHSLNGIYSARDDGP